MDPDKKRALSDFYREEFMKHLELLQVHGLVPEKHEMVKKACNRLVEDLDRVCWREEFPAVAETLLQNFDALTRLSEHDSRPAH